MCKIICKILFFIFLIFNITDLFSGGHCSTARVAPEPKNIIFIENMELSGQREQKEEQKQIAIDDKQFVVNRDLLKKVKAQYLLFIFLRASLEDWERSPSLLTKAIDQLYYFYLLIPAFKTFKREELLNKITHYLLRFNKILRSEKWFKAIFPQEYNLLAKKGRSSHRRCNKSHYSDIININNFLDKEKEIVDASMKTAEWLIDVHRRALGCLFEMAKKESNNFERSGEFNINVACNFIKMDSPEKWIDPAKWIIDGRNFLGMYRWFVKNAEKYSFQEIYGLFS